MFGLWTKRSIVHALVFVRLAHDRRFVGAVLFLFVLVRFVFIRISGRHCVAHDQEGPPVDQPGGKFLADVWGHVVAPSGVDASEAKLGALGKCHSGFLSGRSISSYAGTWVLSRHDSRAAPQTVQTASPVCGTKNFSSVRLYSAPQLHCTIVAIPGICASDRRFSSPELCHNRTDHYPTRQRFQMKNHLRKLVPRELSLSKCLPGSCAVGPGRI